MRIFISLFLLSSLLVACSTTRSIHRSAQKNVIEDPVLQNAHVGISIYEPATGRWWYNWQGDKFFVPASNIKIVTCYAAMKYLGDSIPAARIAVDEQARLRIYPTGDPTFLHPEFRFQPLFQKMKQYKSVLWSVDNWKGERWGNGWSWNDYDAAYMAERSPLPIYGNMATFFLANDTLKTIPSKLALDAPASIGLDKSNSVLSSKTFQVIRGLDDNTFILKPAIAGFSRGEVPLRMDAGLVSAMLEDTLKTEVVVSTTAPGDVYKPQTQIIYSQPTDSLLRPMMHRSDNFFAEQALLMVSNKVLGYMSDDEIIDTLLKTDLSELPHKPRWADGSGLSRYNLFTPQDFVAILQKMKIEFGMDRLRHIFASGGGGTLSNYYKAEKPYLYAKTGTLSGVVALSGYLTTVKGRELIVSVLVNNHRSNAVQVRRSVERFLQNIRDEY